ncbi:MAG: restriction endonuclease subunit S [Candidatus Paceibacterota bacterium]|jgi:type I restriction enzyme S subunit
MSFDKELKLGDTFQELPKSKFQVQHADNIGHYPFYTSGDKVLTHSEFNLDDDIIFLATGGKANVKFNSGKAAYSTDTFAIKGKEHSSKYLYYLLLDKLSYIDRNFFSGSGLKHLQKKDFRNWLLNFPDDTNEEERIVQLLSTLDRAIASTEQLIAKYQRIKTGLLHDLLTRGIDEHGDLRSEKTHKFKDSKLGRIPVEWECKPLGEIYTDLKSGSTPLRKNKAYFENGTFLWVKTLDLNEDDIFDTQEKITKRAIEESSCNLFPVNSVLIAMYGGWEQIGRTAVLKKEATTNQAITALFNPRIGIVAEYIQFFLQHFRYKWKSYAVSTRKDPNITKTDIQNYLIAFPKEDAEQQNIVKAIKNSKRTISNYNDYLTKLQSLKTGLMQDLLSGKVRIKI